MANYSRLSDAKQPRVIPPCIFCGGTNSNSRGKADNGKPMRFCKDCRRAFTVGSTRIRARNGGLSDAEPCPACGSRSTTKLGFSGDKQMRRCRDCGKIYNENAAWRVKRVDPATFPCRWCGSLNTIKNGGVPVAGNPDGHRRLCKDCGKNYTALGRGTGNPGNGRPVTERKRVPCPLCGHPARKTTNKRQLGRQSWGCGQCRQRWLSYTETFLILLQATGGHCQVCALDLSAAPKLLEVDHIQPRKANGNDDIENLTLLCHSCNSVKGDNYTLTEARERVRLLYGLGDESRLLTYRGDWA